MTAAPTRWPAPCRAVDERDALAAGLAAYGLQLEQAHTLLDHLVSQGMLPPYMVRALVLSAGGHVVLKVDQVADSPGNLMIVQSTGDPFAPIHLQVIR